MSHSPISSLPKPHAYADRQEPHLSITPKKSRADSCNKVTFPSFSVAHSQAVMHDQMTSQKNFFFSRNFLATKILWLFVAFCGVLWLFVAFCGMWLFGDFLGVLLRLSF
jgi:hypothetical protein